MHGYNTTFGDNYAVIAPVLRAAGYCVYGLNWGTRPGQDTAGIAPLREGAAQLHELVDKVLAHTGAPQVDLVGHSAGGVMPRWYINTPSGSHQVRRFFALAPATRGTNLMGLTALTPQLVTSVLDTSDDTKPAGRDLVAGSAFLKELNRGSFTQPHIRYQVVSTVTDEMVTPYTSQFLPAAPNVQNITLQKLCPGAIAFHGDLAWHLVVLQLLENFLGDTPAPVVCTVH